MHVHMYTHAVKYALPHFHEWPHDRAVKREERLLSVVPLTGVKVGGEDDWSKLSLVALKQHGHLFK